MPEPGSKKPPPPTHGRPAEPCLHWDYTCRPPVLYMADYLERGCFWCHSKKPTKNHSTGRFLQHVSKYSPPIQPNELDLHGAKGSSISPLASSKSSPQLPHILPYGTPRFDRQRQTSGIWADRQACHTRRPRTASSVVAPDLARLLFLPLGLSPFVCCPLPAPKWTTHLAQVGVVCPPRALGYESTPVGDQRQTD